MDQTEKNKQAVLRFNHEFIAQANLDTFKELVAGDFINHTAAHNVTKGPDGLLAFVQQFHQSFSNLRIEVLHQLAEGDAVATRKIIHGTHSGPFMGVSATGKTFGLDVMDFVRLENGQYKEHWGMRDLQGLAEQLAENV